MSDERITRIICPDCGVEMVPHAEKPVPPLTGDEAARADWAVGGIVEQIHACPRCERVESRRSG